jgi:hypothetical protein
MEKGHRPDGGAEKQARELAAAMSEREKLAAELLALTGDRDAGRPAPAAEAKALSTSADKGGRGAPPRDRSPEAGADTAGGSCRRQPREGSLWTN